MVTPERLAAMETTHAHLFTRRERKVIYLKWREGLSYAEIAEELTPPVSIRTVGAIINKIKSKIEYIDFKSLG